MNSLQRDLEAKNILEEITNQKSKFLNVVKNESLKKRTKRFVRNFTLAVTASASLSACMTTGSMDNNYNALDLRPETTVATLMSSEKLSEYAQLKVQFIQDKKIKTEDIKETALKIINDPKDIDKIETNITLNKILKAAKEQPLALFHPIDKDIGCIVSVPNEFTDPKILLKFGSSIHPSVVENFPGTPEQIRAFITFHEIQHCKQNMDLAQKDPIYREIDADQVAIQAYKRLIKEDPNLEVPKAFIGLRYINALNQSIQNEKGKRNNLFHITETFVKFDQNEPNPTHSVNDARVAYKNLAQKVTKLIPSSYFIESDRGAKYIIGALKHISKTQKLLPLEQKISDNYIKTWSILSDKISQHEIAQGSYIKTIKAKEREL